MDYTVNAPDGSEHVITGPAGASDDEVIAQAQKLFGTSAPEAFGRAAINNLPLGGQLGALGTAALKGEDYSQGMKEFNQKATEAKAEHPIAYGTGAVAGSVAPILIPGVGEAMAASPVMGGAALGAANAVGNTDIAQNPSQALKQGLEGAVTGGALGAVLPSGTKAAESLESYANKKGVQALNLRPGTLGVGEDELENLGRFAHEADLVNGSTQERVQKASDLLQQTGAQIGDIGAGAQPVKDLTPYIDNLQSEAQKSAKFFGTEGNQDLNMYRQGIANLQRNGNTFDELQALKTAYGEKAFNSNGEVVNEAAAKIYGNIKDAMKSIVADSPAEYQDLMTSYGTLKDIHSGLMSQLQKEQASGIQAKGFGIAGKLAGLVGGGNPAVNVGLGAALAPAHPFMAVGAMTPLITNPQAMSGIARGVAETLPKAAAGLKFASTDAVTTYLLKTMQSNPQALGKYAKPLMQAAQTGGSQGLAVQHFLLSQQYPDYSQMIQAGAENGAEGKPNEPQ